MNQTKRKKYNVGFVLRRSWYDIIYPAEKDKDFMNLSNLMDSGADEERVEDGEGQGLYEPVQFDGGEDPAAGSGGLAGGSRSTGFEPMLGKRKIAASNARESGVQAVTAAMRAHTTALTRSDLTIAKMPYEVTRDIAMQQAEVHRELVQQDIASRERIANIMGDKVEKGYFVLADLLMPFTAYVLVQTVHLSTWRDGLLAAISFHFPRDLMMGYVKELEKDATVDTENLLKEDRLWNYLIPALLARIMLPTRIPEKPTRFPLNSPRAATRKRGVGAQDQSSSINALGQMTTLSTGRRSWKRQKWDCDVFLHLRYTSRVMEPLSIRRLINEVLARIIGDETTTRLERTMIGWTYNDSIASRQCRPAEVLCDFNVAQWMEAYDPEQCPCKSRRYMDNASIEPLQSEGHTHVITLDSSITDNPLLQGIINSGLNHIPCMTLDVDEVENEVCGFLDRLLAMVLELRELTMSTRSFLRRIILKKARAKMTKYKEQHRHVTAESFKHPAVKRELLTSRFLISPTNKAPSTPAFVCKNFIRKLAFQRLSKPEFASIAAPPASIISRIQGELSALPAMPTALATLPYLVMVFKAHKGAFHWTTNTTGIVVSPTADLCACLLRFLLPLVQTFCQERSLELEERYGVKVNLWWWIASVGEFCANLPEKIYSIFTADITRCFATIPTDSSGDSLLAAVRFYVQSVMQVQRERSSSHTIRIKVGEGARFWPSWVDGDQAEGLGSMLFGEEDVCWIMEWRIANSVQSGSAASPDPAAAAVAATAAATSGGTGTSGTVAAPGPDPATVGPGGSFAYIDRKAAQIPSKYDGKDDVEAWISSMRSYFDVLGTPLSTQSSILGTNVEPVVRGS
ncbi:hypothetical protein CBR_g12650 [Chara braunii]|uniref:Uncharacterized protein n=1 Tax=Chara braunii TaxID=69332 RepID=A0A388KSF5_CHABU|nr:hypothetical protein CBR_g12650 [Chara braunii]|eukprot:GBG72928.1 hypothetical protein CBR_g12650 [Chara braunii]